MSSLTGRLSITVHVIPASSIISFLLFISSIVQTSPTGIWCKAVTTPVHPDCRMSHKLTGSFGPNQRIVSSINIAIFEKILLLVYDKDFPLNTLLQNSQELRH